MTSDDLTPLLARAREGDAASDRETFSVVYDALRDLARRQLRRSPSNTLNTTGLVHEAWMRLVSGAPDFASRAHFFAVAAKAMRQILVDHARKRHAQKRGGDASPPVTLSDAGEDTNIEQILAIDEALTKLAALDERMAKVVEWRFFAGFEEGEIARALEVDVRTVRRDWRKARAFILTQLGDG